MYLITSLFFFYRIYSKQVYLHLFFLLLLAMKVMSKKKVHISFLFAFFISQLAFGQVNFFTDDSMDSLATNFYQRNKKATIVAIMNVPSLQVGAIGFIHNGENKASYFVELKSNFGRHYVVNGEECYGEGTRQKDLPYRTTSLNVGVSRGFTRNWFIYGGFGMVVKRTDFDNKIEDNYRYHIDNQGVWFNVAVGAMYVTDSDFSVLAGMDLYDRSVTLGIGYSL